MEGREAGVKEIKRDCENRLAACERPLNLMDARGRVPSASSSCRNYIVIYPSRLIYDNQAYHRKSPVCRREANQGKKEVKKHARQKIVGRRGRNWRRRRS
jgi:hypothetical protein